MQKKNIKEQDQGQIKERLLPKVNKTSKEVIMNTLSKLFVEVVALCYKHYTTYGIDNGVPQLQQT